MDCANVRENLQDLVRARIPGSEIEKAMLLHLQGCEACRHEAEVERLLDSALAERLPRPAASAALRRSLERMALPSRRATLTIRWTTARRFMTGAARRRKKVWRVTGTGPTGMAAQAPAAMRATKVAVSARRAVRSGFPCMGGGMWR